MSDLSDAKRRIIEALKRVESATAHQLADEFNTTTTAVRQHLEALETAQLVVRFESAAQGRGRPALHWQLAPMSRELFPDQHGELTVELIESIRQALGEESLERVISHRAEHQVVAYRQLMSSDSLEDKVRRLAAQRSSEGYLAEVVKDGEGFVLIEHHCPICIAASSCQGLCRSELEVFKASFGTTVSVTRSQHLLSGDTRCSYRVCAVEAG
jgi:predicted ArsR family transcriptional regulator